MFFSRVRLQLLKMLGEGGQGRVYKALRSERGAGLKQTVAIKILHSKTAVTTWRREFESLSRVRSPYCVQVLSFERFRGRPALILEFVDGLSLAALGTSCWLGPEDITEILAQLELGLKDLHSFGVPHGDLSPQNVLVDRDGRVRILDFGLANSSEDESRLTPAFAAPERLQGSPANLASDIFSLGRIEEFLRGGPDPKSPYTLYSPTSRAFRDLNSSAAQRRQVAVKIRDLMARQSLFAGSRTISTVISAPLRPQIKSWLMGTMAALSILITSSAAQFPRPEAFGEINLRTRHWHHVRLNGRPIGYTPIQMSLRAGVPHKLVWTSASGQGEKTLVLRKGERRTLEDSDFSH